MRKKCYKNFQYVECSIWRTDRGRTQVFGWFSKFKSGVKTSEDVECSETSINKKNAWRCESSEGICSQRQKDALFEKLLICWEFNLV